MPLLFNSSSTPSPEPEPNEQTSSSNRMLFNPNFKAESKKIGKTIDKTVGNPIVEGFKHPLELANNVLGATGRATDALEVYGPNLGKIGEAITNPKEGQELLDKSKEKLGVKHFEDTYEKGDGWLPKAERGVTDTLFSMGNDVGNVVAGPLVRGAIGLAKPVLGAAGKVLGSVPALNKIGTGARDLVTPGSELNHLSPADKNTVQALYNIKKTNTEKDIKAAMPTLVNNAKAIYAGQMPQDVVNLFHNQSRIPPAGPKLNPKEVLDALKTDIAAHHHGDFQYPDPKSYLGQLEAHRLRDTATESLGHEEPEKNVILKGMQFMRDRQNQMFFTIPAAHPLNLTDFSYNAYGAKPTLEGLRRTAELMSGKPSPQTLASIQRMEAAGGGHIYHDTYTGLARNPLLQAGQRASNKANDFVLNNTEAGLRSAAFDSLIAKGMSDTDAAVHVSKAFGTDLPSKLTKGFTGIGASFARFHGQSVIGSGLKTLANNPQRITNTLKVQQGINRTPEGNQPGAKSPKYMSGVPGMSIERAAGNPLGYAAPLFGPLGEIASAYSTYTDVEKGKISAALSQLAGRYIPADDTINALWSIILGNKGRSGEPAANDLITSLTGGWYTKRE